jgi:hypothetical protein
MLFSRPLKRRCDRRNALTLGRWRWRGRPLHVFSHRREDSARKPLPGLTTQRGAKRLAGVPQRSPSGHEPPTFAGAFARPASQCRRPGGSPAAVRASPMRMRHADRTATSAEDRDPDGDPPRLSNRARQYPRNRIRRASSIPRDRAAPPRSANARSPRKCFRWLGNCRGSTAIQRLHKPSVFSAALGSATRAGGRGTSFR